MTSLEIPANVTTFEQVAKHIERRGRALTDFYYNHLGLEVKGHTPHVVEHEYYLHFGVDFEDSRPWKSRTWHIPQFAQEEAYRNLLSLKEKHQVVPYYEQSLRRKWILHFRVMGNFEDDRGRAIADFETSRLGRVGKITHTRGNL